MKVKNKHKINKEAWNKWTEQGKELFNYLYEFMKENQNLFIHPKMKEAPGAQWNTTAYNAAWEAARFVSDVEEM